MNEEKEQKKTEEDLMLANPPVEQTDEEHPSFIKRFYASAKEIVKFVIISLIIVVPFRMWVAQPFIVSGASMEPNFWNGDYLIVDELSFALRNPKRGEVVILKLPRNSSFFIKRVIGLPNETVEIKNGKIHLLTQIETDFVLQEKYIDGASITYPDSNITLKENEYFLMGDNREKSLDSRMWGPISKNDILGRAFIRLWPIESISFVTANAYEK